MSGTVNVDTAEGLQAAQAVDAVVEQIRGALGEVNRDVAEVVGTAWMGTAVTKFAEAQQAWDDESRALNAVLAEIENALGSSFRGFDGAEDEAGGGFSIAPAGGVLRLG